MELREYLKQKEQAFDVTASNDEDGLERALRKYLTL